MNWSLDYEAITIEFVNCLPIEFNGDILFELPLVRHPLGYFEQLQGMDRKFNGHVWCKLQTSNIKNLFRLGFKTTKCIGHLCYQNDFSPLFLSYPMRNEISCIVGIICNFQYLGNIGKMYGGWRCCGDSYSVTIQ